MLCLFVSAVSNVFINFLNLSCQPVVICKSRFIVKTYCLVGVTKVERLEREVN